MTFSRGDFWYAPNVKVNDIQDGPFGSSLSANDEESYYDFVFLKSLHWDPNMMTTNSSINNIKNKDNYLNDSIDESQDIADYQKMQTLKDKDGNLAIDEGMSLVNRYLNNSLLNFNDKGDIPSRTTYFTSLKTNNINDEAKQTVITNKYDTQGKSNFNIGDYLSLNLHWYGIDIDLKPKLISKVLIYVLNKIITSIADKFINKEVNKFEEELFNRLKNMMFDAAEEFMAELDEDLIEDPEIIAILDPIYSAIAYEITNQIGNEMKKELNKEIKDFVDEDKSTLNKLFQLIIEPAVAHSLDPKAVSFELQIDLHWLIWRSKIHLIPICPPVVYETILVPSHPSLMFKGVSSVLTGTTNDFTLIMNKDKWWSFKSAIDNNNVSDYLKNISIYNSNIILESIDWRNIMLKIVNLPNPVVTIANGYAACIHIIRKPGQDFQIAYTNLNVNDCKNMPLSENKPWLKASFIGDNTSNNFLIENSQFRSLLDSYNYAKINWEDKKDASGKVIAYGIKNSNQNPNHYNDWKTWFYHTYIICDSIHISSDVAIWKTDKISQSTIINLFDKYYNDYYLISEKNNKIDFSSLVSNTTDNTNQILDIENINL